MDARIEKTITKIQDSYLEEKKGKTIDKIHVTDLCRRAGINKTTFYNHYQDVFELAEKMETAFIREILSSCTTIPTILSDPRSFFTELGKVSLAREKRLRLLFETRFIEYMEKLCRILLTEYAEYLPTERDKVIVSVCLVGFPFFLTKDFSDQKMNKAIDWICEIIEKTKKETAHEN